MRLVALAAAVLAAAAAPSLVTECFEGCGVAAAAVPDGSRWLVGETREWTFSLPSENLMAPVPTGSKAPPPPAGWPSGLLAVHADIVSRPLVASGAGSRVYDVGTPSQQVALAVDIAPSVPIGSFSAAAETRPTDAHTAAACAALRAVLPTWPLRPCNPRNKLDDLNIAQTALLSPAAVSRLGRLLPRAFDRDDTKHYSPLQRVPLVKATEAAAAAAAGAHASANGGGGGGVVSWGIEGGLREANGATEGSVTAGVARVTMATVASDLPVVTTDGRVGAMPPLAADAASAPAWALPWDDASAGTGSSGVQPLALHVSLVPQARVRGDGANNMTVLSVVVVRTGVATGAAVAAAQPVVAQQAPPAAAVDGAPVELAPAAAAGGADAPAAATRAAVLDGGRGAVAAFIHGPLATAAAGGGGDDAISARGLTLRRTITGTGLHRTLTYTLEGDLTVPNTALLQHEQRQQAAAAAAAAASTRSSTSASSSNPFPLAQPAGAATPAAPAAAAAASRCYLALHQRLEAHTYMDLDEVREYERNGGPLARAFARYIDVERPTSTSTQHAVLLAVPLMDGDARASGAGNATTTSVLSTGAPLAALLEARPFGGADVTRAPVHPPTAHPASSSDDVTVTLRASVTTLIHMRYQGAGCGAASASSSSSSASASSSPSGGAGGGGAVSQWASIFSRFFGAVDHADGSVHIEARGRPLPPRAPGDDASASGGLVRTGFAGLLPDWAALQVDNALATARRLLPAALAPPAPSEQLQTQQEEAAAAAGASPATVDVWPFFTDCYAMAYLPQPSVHLGCDNDDDDAAGVAAGTASAGGYAHDSQLLQVVEAGVAGAAAAAAAAATANGGAGGSAWVRLPVTTGSTSLPGEAGWCEECTPVLAPVPVGTIAHRPVVSAVTAATAMLGAVTLLVAACASQAGKRARAPVVAVPATLLAAAALHSGPSVDGGVAASAAVETAADDDTAGGSGRGWR